MTLPETLVILTIIAWGFWLAFKTGAAQEFLGTLRDVLLLRNVKP